MITEISAKFGYTVSMGPKTFEFSRIDIGMTKTVNIEFEEEAANEAIKLATLLEEKVLEKVSSIECDLKDEEN